MLVLLVIILFLIQLSQVLLIPKNYYLLKVIFTGILVYSFLGIYIKLLMLAIIPNQAISSGLVNIALSNNTNKINPLLSKIVILQLLYLVSIIFGTLILRRITQQSPIAENDLEEKWFLRDSRRVLVLANLISVISFTVLSINLIKPITSATAPMGTLALSYQIIYTKRSEIFKGFNIAILLMGAANTIFLTIFWGASKSPALFVIISLFIRSLRASTISSNRLKKYHYFLIAFSFLIFFQYIQSYKLGSDYEIYQKSLGSFLPAYLVPLFPIFFRFDLLRAITESALVVSGSWLTQIDYWKISLKALIWDYGSISSNQSFGQRWNTEVSSVILGSRGKSQTALSTGIIAEGNIINGYVGVVVLTLLFFCFLLGLNKLGETAWLSGKFAMLYMLLSNSIFESGFPGLFSSLSAAIKIYMVVALLQFVVFRPNKLRHLNEISRKQEMG